MTHFSTADHLAEVLEAYGDPADERVGEITRAAIKHLFAFAEEVGLTREEWLAGPFHVPGAPMLAMGETILVDDDPGPELTFRGTVRNLDGSVLDGAELDVWQGASNGLYNVQDADQSDTNLRGRFLTGPDGRYEFRTVRPVAYPVPEDGPVGAMLRATGRHNWRPAHTHVVVSAAGHKTVITHLFDRESAYLDSDTVFGVRESLVVDMSQGVVDYDFILEPAD